MNDFISEEYIKKAIAILKPNNQLFECRVIGKSKKVPSGYFRDADTLISGLKKIDLRDANIYITLGNVNETCYAREQRNRFRSGVPTTSDGDIIAYNWLFVDLDPIRPTGVSSSKDELKAAADVAQNVYSYLKNIGFEEPVKALSGNGYHLLYRIGLSNNQENRDLVKLCLETLASMFDTELVHVDTVNHNPARICKLHGTLAQKGANTAERPHRMSKILSDDINVKATDRELLVKLCGNIEPKQKQNSPRPATTYTAEKFDLDDFLMRNGITYENRGTGRDSSIIYALDECPFNSSHINGDAKIFKYPDGAISFLCHHNSCAGKKWQDVRIMFDPSAYDHKDIDQKYEDGWREHNRNKPKQYVETTADDDTPMFRNAVDIYADKEPDHEYIKTGITKIDSLMHGLEKQCISVVSGLRGCGKSTMIGTLICNAVDFGHTTVVYSGELANKKYLNWLLRQAAGKNYLEVSTTYQNGVGVKAEAAQKIVEWMGDNFWLYNNRCGNDFRKIETSLRQILIEKKADLCIIDNLMALDLSTLDKDKYEAQTKFILKLKDIAIETNTHIICVAHPKKANGFIRLEDISGSSNIGNAVDNAFMVHRYNRDFEKQFMDYFKAHPTSKQFGIEEDCTNIIEIAKDRENGTMDEFVSLYFEPESKRLMNSKYEFIHYGWEGDEQWQL